MLPAPGLFTTTTAVGTSFFSCSIRSTVRAVLSLLPPGAEGTTISTGFDGAQLCAEAFAAPSTSATAPQVHRPGRPLARFDSVGMMLVSPWFESRVLR